MNTAKNTLTASILALALIAPAAFAAPVEVSLDRAGLNFITKAGALDMGYKLTVSGPDGYLAVDTFEGGALPYFDTAGLDNGSYKYELTAILAEPVSTDRGFTPTIGALASGAFLVKNGSTVDPTVRENVDEKAQVYATDLIVQGSGCIGFDCTSSESFGFDTLRVKENNLRIHFDDTSSSASFPKNDWRLIANDSSNGGAEYFAIEDSTAGRTPFKVEAGAIANALYVDSEGDVGVGTSNPVVEVHAVDGNTPTLRLEQDGSSGFTPQTWDVAGNETNFFVRDVTGGSKLPLRIKPGAPDDSLFVAANGNLGNGTDSPAEAFHAKRTSGNVKVELETTDAAVAGFDLKNPAAEWSTRVTATGVFAVRDVNNSINPLSIALASGDVTLDALKGGGTESSVCVDNDGKLCRCGSC